MLRKKQEVGGKIGHEEYTYYLGDPNVYTQDARLRGQGDIQRPSPGQVGPANIYHKGQQESRPPWGIEADDNPRNRRPSAAPSNNNNYNNNNNALVPASGPANRGAPGGIPQSSPYRGAPVVPYDAWPAPQQPQVMAFGPVVASNLPPVQPLTGVLPPIYRPKPPLSFQSAPMNPYYAAPPAPSASPQPLYYPPSGGFPGGTPYLQPFATPRGGPYGGGGVPEIEMTPTKGSPAAARPTSSPGGFLPPLYGAPDTPAVRGRRRSSASNIPGLGGIGGGDGPDGEQQAQADARRRAQQLQDENARLMEAQQARKNGERQRKIDEDLVEERRLQKEREAVAKRELAEVEREREEKEMKMMGPAAYAAKKRQEAPPKPTEAPVSPAPEPAARAATEDRPKSETPSAPLFALPQSSSSTTNVSHTYLTQQAPPLQQALMAPAQRVTTYSYESDHLKAELRQIADEQRRLERLIAESLRANQATAAATLRAVSSANAAAVVAGGGGGRVSLGAGTYLTDALPLSGARRSSAYYSGVSSPAPAVPASTLVYAQGLPPPPSASPSWLDAYLTPNPAPSAAGIGGAYPTPASTTGLGWGTGPDLTTSTRVVPPSTSSSGGFGTRDGPGGITVLASQIHAATSDWNSAQNRSTDPDDLSFEPSTFVGPVVPPQSAAEATRPASSLPPTPSLPPSAEYKGTPNTPSLSILKRTGTESPHDSQPPERRSGGSAVHWDEL